MNKNCTLIATLPSLNNLKKVLQVFQNETIKEVRFNTGVQVSKSEYDVIKYLKDLSEEFNKKLWIDIKGRQLRVIKWADPLYSCIELNHNVNVDTPAKIYLRGEDPVNIMEVKGNKLFVDPLPKHAVGAGQSVNILGTNLVVDTYLTDRDKLYLEACKKLGVSSIMASFVEEQSDLDAILQILPNAEIVSKIESLKGIKFVSRTSGLNLMAARDDLYTEVEKSYQVFKMLKLIVEKDTNAICASRIFTSLEKHDRVSLNDYSDVELMYNMGYRRFMLCDNVCNFALYSAIQAWEEFVNG